MVSCSNCLSKNKENEILENSYKNSIQECTILRDLVDSIHTMTERIDIAKITDNNSLQIQGDREFATILDKSLDNIATSQATISLTTETTPVSPVQIPSQSVSTVASSAVKSPSKFVMSKSNYNRIGAISILDDYYLKYSNSPVYEIGECSDNHLIKLLTDMYKDLETK